MFDMVFWFVNLITNPSEPNMFCNNLVNFIYW